MFFYDSDQKPAAKTGRQSASQAPAIDKIHDRDYDRPVNNKSGISKYIFEDRKTIIDRFVEGTEFEPPIGDDRRFGIGPYIGEPQLSRWASRSHIYKLLNQPRGLWTSPSSSTSFPTGTTWTTPRVQRKGPQSLRGIRNRDTISKDNTMGEEENMNDLLATFGKRTTGIKHKEQLEATSPEDAWKRLKIGRGSQYNGHSILVSESSERRLEDLGRRAGSDDAEADKQVQKPTESKKGLQSLSGIRNRDTISKDNTGEDEARMDNLLASFGRRAMRVKPEAFSWKQHIVGPGFEQKNGRIFEVHQSSERRPQVLRINTGDSYIDPIDDKDDILGDVDLILGESDQQEKLGFI